MITFACASPAGRRARERFASRLQGYVMCDSASVEDVGCHVSLPRQRSVIARLGSRFRRESESLKRDEYRDELSGRSAAIRQRAGKLKMLRPEFVPEPLALLLIPGCSCGQIPARLFPETDGRFHSPCRISAITSSARRPAFPSDSYAFRRQSNSVCCSGVSGSRL